MRSIRSRLLVFLVPATVAALVLAAAGIDRAVTGDLEAARDRQLLLLAQGIASSVDLTIDGTVEFELQDGEMPELEQSAAEGFYAIADESGTLLFSSETLPYNLFAAVKEEPVFLHAETAAGLLRFCLLSIYREPESDDEDREEWREEHPDEELPAAEPQWLRVAAGLPDEGLRATLLAVRRSLIFGFGILAVFQIVIPIWAAGISLKPLRRLSCQADAVGADTPDGRLDAGGADREVRSLVDALNSALTRLACAYEQQKRFTADAAHELRSPLSAIRAQCEVNLRRERSREELTEVLRSVHRTTLRLGDVVESLLSLSRLQNGSAVIEKKEVDIASAAHEAASLLAPLAQSREVQMEESLPGNLPVTGERRLLLECLTNIIDNAIRYTPAGGKVVIAGGEEPRPWIAVTDTGPGIPEDQRERIFERFYRIDPARSRDKGGSGLGLFISRAIARLHGADISVASGHEGGSRFSLNFGPDGIRRSAGS